MPMFRLNISLGGPTGVLAVFLVAAAAQPILAQDQAPATRTPTAATPPGAPSPPSKVLTGKERLGPKWTDEQRTDNCRVPLDKRGPTPRPDSCSDGSR
jgi:hypothetical protein